MASNLTYRTITITKRNQNNHFALQEIQNIHPHANNSKNTTNRNNWTILATLTKLIVSYGMATQNNTILANSAGEGENVRSRGQTANLN